MNLLDFLDRRDERRLHRPERPLRDIRQFIGFAFLAGYYFMVFRLIELREELPPNTLGLIRDALLTLGPPIGIIIGAMFRSDARDEQATRNTAIALDAARQGAKAAMTGSTHEEVATQAAEETADAAVDKAEEIKGKGKSDDG